MSTGKKCRELEHGERAYPRKIVHLALDVNQSRMDENAPVFFLVCVTRLIVVTFFPTHSFPPLVFLWPGALPTRCRRDLSAIIAEHDVRMLFRPSDDAPPPSRFPYVDKEATATPLFIVEPRVEH
jgi:hypothetical protein